MSNSPKGTVLEPDRTGRRGARPGIWLLRAATVVVSVTAALLGWWWHENKPVRLMRGHSERSEWLPALRAALPYLAAHPDDAEAIRITARSLSGLGRYEEAESYFARAGDLGLDDLRLRAETLIALDRVTEAAEVLIELCRLGGEEPAVLQRLAILQFQRGRHPEALQLAEQLRQRQGYEAVAWCMEATFHASLHQSQQAVDCLDKALAIHPDGKDLGLDPATVPVFVGAAFLDVGRYSEAQTWLSRAAESAPTATGYWYLGEAELGRANPAAAEVAWRKALELEHNHPNALISLGKLMLQQARPIEALEWLTLAERAGKPTTALWSALARTNARLGRTDLAELYSQKAQQLRTERDAKHDEERLLESYPDHIQSRLFITRKAIEQGNVAEAKALVGEVLRDYPQNAELIRLQEMLQKN